MADGASAVQDRVAAGTAEPGVSASGTAGNGTVWSPHNLLTLLQKRGLINQTTYSPPHLCSPRAGPAETTPSTPSRRRCGTNQPRAAFRISAGKALHCGSPLQNPPSDYRPPPALPPFKPSRPPALPPSDPPIGPHLVTGHHHCRLAARHPPSLWHRLRSRSRLSAGCPFFTHRLTAWTLYPNTHPRALGLLPSVYMARPVPSLPYQDADRTLPADSDAGSRRSNTPASPWKTHHCASSWSRNRDNAHHVAKPQLVPSPCLPPFF